MKNPSFALVTGASQGLGRVFAHALAARGQNVILVARSRDKLEGPGERVAGISPNNRRGARILTLLLHPQVRVSLRKSVIGNLM